ncbi:MAG: hypothetical protein WA220_00900 [Candidatus Nitrosopolaris sp.]
MRVALALVMSIYHTIMVIIDLTPSPVFLTTFILALIKNDFGIESHRSLQTILN